VHSSAASREYEQRHVIVLREPDGFPLAPRHDITVDHDRGPRRIGLAFLKQFADSSPSAVVVRFAVDNKVHPEDTPERYEIFYTTPRCKTLYEPTDADH
jgi:hypothetical protein